LKHANDLYAQNEFIPAAQEYEKLLEEGQSAELYYNLGNAYYKSNEIGLAILNYERALRLSPRYPDAKYNLEMAAQRIVDLVDEEPVFFVKRWFADLISFFPSNRWFYIGWTFFLLALAGFFLFIFAPSRGLRKFSFNLSIIFIVICGITLLFSGIRKKNYINRTEAIVLSGVITVKSSPDKNGTELFKLHEGTKVNIKNTLNNWAEITLSNGAVGWTEFAHIEPI
jgi:tetratricopeptide (TPR) repeat protein